MCGILGIIAPPGKRPSVSTDVAAGMRDCMRQRGPDDAGFAEHRNVLFAHRRLKVIDPDGGAQPMWSPDRRYLLIYNGELYNDAEIRRQLQQRYRIEFRTRCDTETLLHALIAWGSEALTRLRGMFAFALYDFVENRVLLARDPFGIKPLYYATIGREIVVASAPAAILAHPGMTSQPDAAVVSAYLSTIRTTLGRRTLFAGVHTALPGECIEVSFAGGQPRWKMHEYWCEPSLERTDIEFNDAAELVREAVIDSVAAHLRSDVPRCLLLSGGLDSAIIASVCRDLGASDALRTWCAADPDDCGEDRRFASRVAAQFGAQHHDTLVDADRFTGAWFDLIACNAIPVSTPNETAIRAVAAALKPHATVALSGEGADELFGGYALPILCGLDAIHAQQSDSPARFRAELAAQYGSPSLGSEAEHYLRSNSWIHTARKGSLLTDEVLKTAEYDRLLHEEIAAQFGRADEVDIRAEQRLLRVHQRINLSGLLGRLDTSTMAESVEGRTPFADVRLAELAATLPFEYKFGARPAADGGWSSAAQTLARGGVETKRVLRAAFARDIPLDVLQRPKASFPLSFQKWLAPAASWLPRAAAAGELFRRRDALALASDPGGQWLTLWPVLNIALWFELHWGDGLPSSDDLTGSAALAAASELG
ncbi:MAG: asparagine synthase (glutamine-hydrolyzing) [Phycisphaerales bacterium]|nr:asparagine synthase (glutamine-hydrolyzing) [Phycisphaerales bacterium]